MHAHHDFYLQTIALLIQTQQPQTQVTAFIPFAHPENHADVLWVNPELTGLTIDMVRELQQSVLTRPYQEKFKIYVIYDLEKSTQEAQQALLKLLEEPPIHVRFLLTSRYPSMLLGTIRSRTQLIIASQSKSQPENEPSLADFLKFSLAEKLEWTEQFKTLEEGITIVTQFLEQTTQLLEQEPSLQHIEHSKTVQQTHEMLQQKANLKLCLEWMAMKLAY